MALSRTCRRWRAAMYVLGYDKLRVNTCKQAGALMEMVKGGLSIRETSVLVTLRECWQEALASIQLNQLLLALGGARAVGLSGCYTRIGRIDQGPGWRAIYLPCWVCTTIGRRDQGSCRGAHD
eukprot:TRINITY_DN6536_c0_g1_i2.p3 TRINITY_DN6536_c0_g1~~TRINITY_DN6536_c0_g1_i2.p3  ORF type:complete len:123 (-),score=0.24 TRINITY_DN6536_c0_g1_i2:719-1087(-)